MRTPDIGTATREDRTRIDFAALRNARRDRVFEEMEQRGIDACLFGRESNGRYVAGHRRLWTSNTRAYMPTCIAVRSTRKVHVMALGASTEDSPEDLPSEDAFGRSFDGATLLGVYASLPGLREAKRIGVDGLSVGTRTLLSHICPHANVIGAEPMMRQIRRIKLPGEIDCLRVAIAVGEASLQCAADALSPGVTGQDLLAAYMERMAALGSTNFAQQGTFRTAPSTATPPFGTQSTAFADGDLVLLAGGAQWAGYEGSLARTWWCGDAAPSSAGVALFERWRETMDRLISQCRPGGSGHDLTEAYTAAGEALPGITIAYSVGMGHEGPVAGSPQGAEFDATQRLAADMVLGVRAWVVDGTRGFLGEEIVHVRHDGPEVLSTMSHGALGRAFGGSR